MKQLLVGFFFFVVLRLSVEPTVKQLNVTDLLRPLHHHRDRVRTADSHTSPLFPDVCVCVCVYTRLCV